MKIMGICRQLRNPLKLICLVHNLPLLVLAILQVTSTGCITVSPQGTGRRPSKPGISKVDYVYQFGDSNSDVGNFNRENSNSTLCARLPFGITGFGRPSGRCSDGLVISDYYAKAFDRFPLNPYLDRSANFRNGVNFAVSSATALNTSELLALTNVTSPYSNSSLSIQVGWFRTFVEAKPGKVREDELKRTVIFMGEIGSNDFNIPLGGGAKVQDLPKLIPGMVSSIRNGVEQVIEKGATRVVVPGLLPLGCFPVVLVATVGMNNPELFDELHCLKVLNDIVKNYNKQLQLAITDYQKQNLGAVIVYADFYAAYTKLLLKAPTLGFLKDALFKTCCGSGNNTYNFDRTKFCGADGVPYCPDPLKYIHWDGIHPTQQANMYLVEYLLEPILPKIKRSVS